MLPWQQHISDVGLEIDPETGYLAYDEIDVIVMRQQGKSEWLFPYQVHRSTAWPSQRVVYAAQTGADARERWEDVYIKRLEKSPFKPLFTKRLRTAAEALLWRNASSMSPIATTGKGSGTGDTIDVGVIDEAWSHNDARVELGMRPAMLTRSQVPPGPQLVVASMVPGPTRLATSATSSAYLKGKIEAGKARVAAGLTRGVAFFLYGAVPGSDPADPGTWWTSMPALGHTIREETVRGDYERATTPGSGVTLADWLAEYLSWWPEDGPALWLVIPQKTWADLTNAESQPVGPLRVALDVNPSQTRGSVAAAGAGSGGGVHLELLHHDAGTTWIPGYLKAVLDKNRDVREVVMVPTGPAGPLRVDVQKVLDDAASSSVDRAAVTLRAVTQQEYAQACGRFLAGALQAPPRWVHRGQDDLNRAVAAVDKTDAGKLWVWTRAAGASMDITPVPAVTLAAWAHETAPAATEPFGFFA